MAESTFKFANASESLEVDQYRTITVASALGTPTYSIEGSTATINTSTGKVTGTAAGVAVTVTASRDAGGTTTDGYLAKTATYQLTVNAATGTPLALTTPAVLNAAETITLSTTGGKGDGAVSFTSSNTGVATTSGSSLTGVGPGNVTITATKAQSSDPDNGWVEQTATYTYDSSAPTGPVTNFLAIKYVMDPSLTYGGVGYIMYNNNKVRLSTGVIITDVKLLSNNAFAFRTNVSISGMQVTEAGKTFTISVYPNGKLLVYRADSVYYDTNQTFKNNTVIVLR